MMTKKVLYVVLMKVLNSVKMIPKVWWNMVQEAIINKLTLVEIKTKIKNLMRVRRYMQPI